MTVEATSVVWPLCTPLDLLADRMEMPRDGEIGDLAVVFQSGAYGRSASPRASRPCRPVWKCWCDRRGHVGRVPAARVSRKAAARWSRCDDEGVWMAHPVGEAELRLGGTVSGPVMMALADVALLRRRAGSAWAWSRWR